MNDIKQLARTVPIELRALDRVITAAQAELDRVITAAQAELDRVIDAAWAQNRRAQKISAKEASNPLVEVMKQAGWADAVIESCAPSLRAALDARGLEIREISK